MDRNTLLIVDDMEVNRAILRILFENTYNILEAENGEQALMLLNQYQDTIAALLLDVVMPVKDGYEVMSDMNSSGLIEKLPVIVITSNDTTENEVRMFDLGASDIIVKPFEPHVVKRRVQNAVDFNLHKQHLEEMVERQATKIQDSKDVIMDVLSSVIEHRSVESGQHVLRIRMFTKLLLENVMQTYPEYGLNESIINVIARASALHDIGKISIPDAILNKPGALTEDEFALMKTHSEKGSEILTSLARIDDKEYLCYAYNICRYHHERWDGNGYPDGLKGENIPICAQAVGIADAYDALTTDRVYKRALSVEKAYNMILNGECGTFSPKLLECFKSVREQFAELSHNYADGRSPKADSENLILTSRLQQTDEQDTQQYGQMKYAAMMRYANVTVMEVNLDNGIYHLVYTANEDFESLRSGDNYEDAIRNFVKKAVYIDDQEIAYRSIEHYEQDFVENGLLKRSHRYRILQHDTREYIWYEATIMRIDIHNPHFHKVLVIWKKIVRESEQSSQRDDKLDKILELPDVLVGTYQCINDQCFTITDVNRGFINLFGYNSHEVERIFCNRYIEMIHPDDRQAVRSQFQEQFLVKNTIQLEYRVIAKDGSTVWILDKFQLFQGEDGIEYLNGVLTDITQVKLAQEELRLTIERHKIIMDQTNDIIFEWDIAQNSLSYSSNWVKKFGYEPISENISVRIPQASHILPEDMPDFIKLMENAKSGKSYTEGELRIANESGRYIWCRVRATTQFDRNGVPIKAVGVILDIEDEKRRTQEWIDKAERDSLTKLYNKSTARHRIEQLLKNRGEAEQFAMMIIDVDNFKMINDSWGHMFGDAVLMEIASQLKRLSSPDDIVARIGGDEFLVFVSTVSAVRFIQNRAENVIKAFHEVFTQDLQASRLSCSIGISCCPDGGTDYRELFQSCDQALYHAKRLGKDRYTLFDKTVMLEVFDHNSDQGLVISTRIESEDTPDLSMYGIVQQTLKVLYEAGDLEHAVNSILELVGRKYNVSRAYIFENSEDGSCCSNTFEWCNEGIEPEIETLQNISYSDDLDGLYYENFDENSVFYCPDISLLPEKQYRILNTQGICSLLQCAIRNNGKIAGYVGFDDCFKNRIWTQAQIDVLTFISELLSIFLLKKRAQDRALAAVQNLQMLLDNQNSWIYVIDPDTYVLMYINAKTHEIAPKAHLGMYCYEAFFNRKSPCEICPACGIREKISQTMEIFNPVLNVWSLADASFIYWRDQEACLLCCHNITPYMR